MVRSCIPPHQGLHEGKHCDIKLEERLAFGKCKCNQHSDRNYFGNRGEGLHKFKAFPLSVSFSHKPCFIPLNTTIRIQLHIVHPLATNGPFTIRERGKNPSTSLFYSMYFFIHGLSPKRVLDCLRERSWFLRANTHSHQIGLIWRKQMRICQIV